MVKLSDLFEENQLIISKSRQKQDDQVNQFHTSLFKLMLESRMLIPVRFNYFAGLMSLVLVLFFHLTMIFPVDCSFKGYDRFRGLIILLSYSRMDYISLRFSVQNEIIVFHILLSMYPVLVTIVHRYVYLNDNKSLPKPYLLFYSLINHLYCNYLYLSFLIQVIQLLNSVESLESSPLAIGSLVMLVLLTIWCYIN